MIFKDISFNSPAENILYDEVLLDLAEKNDSPDILRLWESSQVFVVLGRTSRLEDDVDLAAVQGDRVPVLRRFSGGGTVVQGRGCLNFSLVLSKEKQPDLSDLRRSYQVILEPVSAVMQKLGIAVAFRPISDLALKNDDRKFSGNAQHRGRKYVLHHGTILYDFDLDLISRYLKFPKTCPAYRAGRDHRDFVANIPASLQDIRKAFTAVYGIHTQESFLTPPEKSRLKELTALRLDSVFALGRSCP